MKGMKIYEILMPIVIKSQYRLANEVTLKI